MMGLFGTIRRKFTPRTTAPVVRRGRVATARPRRGVLVSLKRYAGAVLNRLTSSFSSTPRTFDSHVYGSLRTLRARCREIARDEGMARKFISLTVSNVIGAGIKLQSQPRDEDGQIDQLASDAIEAGWMQWSKPINCDIRHRLDWTAQQQLAVRTWARDGEILIEEVIGANAGPFGYALNHLDPELLDIELNEELPNGHRIVMGVEMDEYSRPIAYHLINPGQSSAALVTGGYYHSGMPHRRILADRIIHIFLAEDPGQTRGVPPMSAALARLQQLGDGLDAATVNFRIGALKVAFITNSEGEPSETEEEDSAGGPISDLEPGTVEYLEPGESVTTWDPNYPNNELAPFVKGIKRDISSGLGPSYNSLASDWEGVSFSAGRLGRLDDIDLWSGLQGWISLALHQRVFDSWIRMAISSGMITVPSRTGERRPLDIRRIEKYRATRWQGRGWDSVDELKTVAAARESIALGLTTVSAEIRKRGGDPDSVFRERQAELEKLKELGIVPPVPGMITVVDDKEPEKEQ